MSTTGRPARCAACGVERAIGGSGQCQHGATFGRAAELETADLLRPLLLEGRAQAFDFFVAAGALVAGLLGDGAQSAGARRRTAAT